MTFHNHKLFFALICLLLAACKPGYVPGVEMVKKDNPNGTIMYPQLVDQPDEMIQAAVNNEIVKLSDDWTCMEGSGGFGMFNNADTKVNALTPEVFSFTTTLTMNCDGAEESYTTTYIFDLSTGALVESRAHEESDVMGAPQTRIVVKELKNGAISYPQLIDFPDATIQQAVNDDIARMSYDWVCPDGKGSNNAESMVEELSAQYLRFSAKVTQNCTGTVEEFMDYHAYDLTTGKAAGEIERNVPVMGPDEDASAGPPEARIVEKETKDGTISYPILMNLENFTAQEQINSDTLKDIETWQCPEDNESYDFTAWSITRRFDEKIFSYTTNFDYACGGAYPDTGSYPLTYDLSTGQQVHMDDLLTDDLRGPALTAFILKDYSFDGAPECKEEYKEMEWMYYLTDTEMVFLPKLRHAVKACTDDFKIPLEILKPYLKGNSASMLNLK